MNPSHTTTDADNEAVDAVVLLVVMAHPDDAELWAGGTITNHTTTNQPAVIAVPATGTERDTEAAAGARTLGATLDLFESTPKGVTELVLEHRPTILITHHLDDIHPDHRHLSNLITTVLPEIVIRTGRPRHLFACDSYNNLDKSGHPLYLPTIIDTTTTWLTKLAALRCHTSQPIAEIFEPMAEILGRLHGARIGRPHAEAFHPLPILGRLPSSTLPLN